MSWQKKWKIFHKENSNNKIQLMDFRSHLKESEKKNIYRKNTNHIKNV